MAELYEDERPTSYDDPARRLKLLSPGQDANLLVTAKRMYARLLGAAVAEYEEDLDQIDAEIVYLQGVLAEDLARRAA